MGIVGCKYWNDRNCFAIQDNNVFEACFKKKQVKSWLEDCGPTSAVNAIFAMKGPDFFNNIKLGDFYPQPEDCLTLFFNERKNYADFLKIRKDFNPDAIMCNEIPQLYPLAVGKLFGIKCEFRWEKDWEKLKGYLKNGQSVILLEPGHYTCAVAFDEDKNEVIYNDPWNGHYATGGFNKRYSKQFYDEKIGAFINLFS
jgi:hypothetical protein